MGRKSNAKQKIIDTAGKLFLEKGYESTGIAEIIQKAGIGSGSLYWFFKTKEDLLVAVLEQYLIFLDRKIAAIAFKRSDDPLERIFLILDFYRNFLVDNDFRFGCPIGNIVLELGDRYEKVRQKTGENFELWRSIIKKCLEDVSDKFQDNSDLEAISVFILTVMEGGIIQSRAHKDIFYFNASVEQLRLFLNSVMKNKIKN